MKKAGLRSLRKNIRAEKQTVPELIYLLAGIWSVVLVFDYLPYISFSKAAVLAGMMLVCSGMYGVYVFRRELMFQCSAVLLTALGITAVIGRGLLSVQVNAVIESLTDPAVQNETNVTFAVVILSAVLSVCFFMSTLLCVLICVSVIITSVWGTELSGLVYSEEGFVSRSMQRITGAAENPVANGYVSGGNNYRTGATQLEVALQEQPEETLYLKGFTGSEYAGGEWKPADERVIFQEIASALHWEEWASWISSMYSVLYFTMNLATAEDAPEPRTMSVRYNNDFYGTIYTPYYSVRFNQREAAPGYAYQYYEEGEMDINWEKAADDYTDVPGELQSMKMLWNTFCLKTIRGTACILLLPQH